MSVRCLPAGPNALLVELEDQEAALALAAEIERHRTADWLGRVRDVVPGARTVLLDGIEDPAAVAAELTGWTVAPLPPAPAGEAVEIRCRYDGPDLETVAACWGVDPDQVPEVHTSLAHRVAFCGFVPGFAYISGLGARRAVPRLEVPRPSVDAGSVAVAGPYTGIYPRATPGGWRILGHTDAVLWDPERPRPALLAPGTPVRFTVA